MRFFIIGLLVTTSACQTVQPELRPAKDHENTPVDPTTPPTDKTTPVEDRLYVKTSDLTTV